MGKPAKAKGIRPAPSPLLADEIEPLVLGEDGDPEFPRLSELSSVPLLVRQRLLKLLGSHHVLLQQELAELDGHRRVAKDTEFGRAGFELESSGKAIWSSVLASSKTGSDGGLETSVERTAPDDGFTGRDEAEGNGAGGSWAGRPTS